jgi:hypothetical protein
LRQPAIADVAERMKAAAAPPSSVMNARRFVDGNALSTASAINELRRHFTAKT